MKIISILITKILCSWSVYDLLRFQKFTIGYSWCSEFGCSDNGNQTIFENLYSLSPLHNVRLPLKENVQYPAVLLTTADHDDRVVPLHSYKFIAELQYKIGRSPKQVSHIEICLVLLQNTFTIIESWYANVVCLKSNAMNFSNLDCLIGMEWSKLIFLLFYRQTHCW